MPHDSRIQRPRRVRTLSGVSRLAAVHPAVSRAELRLGDAVVVQTRNSTYRLLTGADGRFVVQGGWFNRQLNAPCRVEVVGCSFGGSALWEDVVAAPGLFLEFSNGVRTTRIQKAWVERSGARCSPN